MPDIDEINRITRGFLEQPLERASFDAFFRLCFHLARGYLRILENRGHRLPVNEYSGLSPRDDLTLDCLGPLFASEPGRPYYPLLDYLKTRITAHMPIAEVAALLQGLIRKHIRQELFNLAKERNPQAANVRRAVRRAMESGPYDAMTFKSSAAWGLQTTRDRRRPDKHPLDDNTLHSYITEACRLFADMPERCRAVLEMLDNDERFANCIEEHRLIATLITVLMDTHEYAPQGIPNPQSVYQLTRHLQHAATAIQQTIEQTFPPLAEKRGFSETERQGYHEALANLMFDFVCHGNHDPLPHYVRESLPSLDSAGYLKTHKYTWETCVADCKARFRKLSGG